jgi:hypothetical protein
MAEKYFSRREAERLLPLIEPWLEEARRQKQKLDILKEDMSRNLSRIMVLGGSLPPYGEISERKTEHDKVREELAETVKKIHDTGCLVKDLDVGLIDFPCLMDGEEVYLCWKLGERRIEYWHGVDEGFAGRKPIDDSAPDEPPPGGSRLQ